MMRSEELHELAAALAEAQAEFTAVPKDAENPFFHSRYASLTSVVKATAPVLAKHGLSVTQFIGMDEQAGDILTTTLLHKSGQFMSAPMRLYMQKRDAQGMGSSVSYARRYSYMSVLGLVADVDDDGHAATNGHGQQQPSVEKVASKAKQDLVIRKALEGEIGYAVLANVIKIAAGSEPTLFETELQAEEWLNKAIPKLPARLVEPVLQNIEAEAVKA